MMPHKAPFPAVRNASASRFEWGKKLVSTTNYIILLTSQIVVVVAQTLLVEFEAVAVRKKTPCCNPIKYYNTNVNVDWDSWHFRIGLPDGINFGSFRKFNCIFSVTNGIFKFDFPFQSSPISYAQPMQMNIYHTFSYKFMY